MHHLLKTIQAKGGLLKLLIVVFIGSFFMQTAQAANINPLHGNAWDLYVYGNGNVIQSIFTGIKMIISTQNKSFVNLFALLATFGFLLLAVAAGFDPGKNFFKMFVHLLVIAAVWIFSISLTANVVITDKLDPAGNNAAVVISDVPAIVSLPAALVSNMGEFFATSIETYFSTPEDFKLTGSNAGQFNLFTKVMDDGNKYRFSDSGIKSSLQAYTNDCVIPALAVGAVNETITMPNANGKPTPSNVQGVSALIYSGNYFKTLSTAKHNAIMTRYYPAQSYILGGGVSLNAITMNMQTIPEGTSAIAGEDTADANAAADVYALGGGDAYGGITIGKAAAAGIVMPCATAYNAIGADLKNYATGILNADSAAWNKTGVNTEYATMMSSALAAASVSYDSPASYILQQSLVNEMSGNFRGAALQAGNNELLQAAAIGQAEAQQVSTWVAGFQTFNNMMGYVYIVLQSFIYGLSPFIIIAMLIPGFGSSIMKNYFQVLIWLSLWMPMLAIINFIITLYAIQDTGSLATMYGGTVNAINQGLLKEKTNMLIIAAQFLGTMTPLISWGIVKGALAFTEFITHGVGSQFAAQAGATAATGNLSMNNLSMNNTSLDKYSTQMSSSVGYKGTDTGINAGSLNTAANMGGSQLAANGSGVQSSAALQNSLSKEVAFQESVTKALSSAVSEGVTDSGTLSKINSIGDSAVRSAALDRYIQASGQDQHMQQLAMDLKSDNAQKRESAVNELKASQASSKVGASIPIPGVGIGSEVNNSTGTNTSAGASGSTGSSASVVVANGQSQTGGVATGSGKAVKEGADHSEATQRTGNLSTQSSNSTIATKALSDQKSYTNALKEQSSYVESRSVAGNMGWQDYQKVMDSLSAIKASYATEMGAHNGEASAAQTELNKQAADAHTGAVKARAAAAGVHANTGGGEAGALLHDAKAFGASVDAKVKDYNANNNPLSKEERSAVQAGMHMNQVGMSKNLTGAIDSAESHNLYGALNNLANGGDPRTSELAGKDKEFDQAAGQYKKMYDKLTPEQRNRVAHILDHGNGG